MPVTIKVNGTCLSLVHKFSNGITNATIPDVCKTPTPGGPVPIPYPNIAQSITLSNGTTTVKGDKAMAANKGSKFSLSNGDNAGTIGGVKSNVFMKEATWILYSFDVKMDGKNTERFTDKMFHNAENAANMQGETQPPATGGSEEKDPCDGAGGDGPHKGGKHSKMKPGGAERGTESHHIPANSVTSNTTGQGPSIQMDVADHIQTPTWGRSAAAIAERAIQKQLVSQGPKGFRAAMMRDIRFIKKKFPGKYDKAIEEMLAYAECKGFI